MVINWFPGHMAKALKDIKNSQKIDLLIEVVDARAINISSFKELDESFNNVPKLKIAIKSDLADLNSINNNDKNLLIGTIKNKKFRNLIIDKIYEILNDKIVKLKSKGLVNPEFYILVVGLPNIGKSSLINFLINKNKLNVANKPGVTKTKELVRINNNLLIYDTPGVLTKKINSEHEGYILSLIGTIKKEILPIQEILQWAFNFYTTHYKNELFKTFKLNNVSDFNTFLNQVANQFNFKTNNGLIDKERTLNYIFKVLSTGEIKVNYEK